MAKYDPLRDYLTQVAENKTEVTLSFRKIESILGDSLPRSAREQRSWWANPTRPEYHPQARAWLQAGWRVDAVDQGQEWVKFARQPRAASTKMTFSIVDHIPDRTGRRAKTLERLRQRVDELIQRFENYADRFDVVELFTGPSLYFHLKTLRLRRQHPSAGEALNDDAFFESLYATLTAWGMHRMGPTGAKLVDLPVLMTSFRDQAAQIRQVERLRIWELTPGAVPQVTQDLWDIIRQLQVGAGRTKIVAGSKALHHLLPDLVPPIDREYTLRFFFHHKTLNRGGERAFREMYPRFHRIAQSCQDEIRGRLGRGMNTSPTKVIDNAIVGYVLEHLK